MNFEVRKISYAEVKPWILFLHYAKRIPSISYAYGLFDKGEMVGACTFGMPASPFLCRGICGVEYKSMVLELNRLILLDGLPKNSASYFVSRCIKHLPKPRILVSYSDTKMNHVGYVYQSTNWIYTGVTKPRTDISAGEGKHPRHHKGDRGDRVYRSPKHRYVFFHGCDGVIKSALKYKALPYPKGDISRYKIDISELTSTDKTIERGRFDG